MTVPVNLKIWVCLLQRTRYDIHGRWEEVAWVCLPRHTQHDIGEKNYEEMREEKPTSVAPKYAYHSHCLATYARCL